MRVGSIVVVKKLPILPPHLTIVKWLPVDDEKTPYIVRDLLKSGGGIDMAFLEEGVLGYTEGGEIGLDLSLLREILPPEDISEQVEDMMCVSVNNSVRQL